MTNGPAKLDRPAVPEKSPNNAARPVSPILANLFLHYAFDLWMTRTYPTVRFERYADDAICHCRTQSEAEALRVALAERFAACGLVLHPQKTKIIYCADTNRKGRYPMVQFDLPRLYRFASCPW